MMSEQKKNRPTGCIHFERGWTCNKVTTPGSSYCPHHWLLIREAEEANQAKMARVRLGKEKKALMDEMLESSPLRANQ